MNKNTNQAAQVAPQQTHSAMVNRTASNEESAIAKPAHIKHALTHAEAVRQAMLRTG